MIQRKDLPDDPVEWNSIAVSFGRLAEDTPESCPCPVDEVFAHVLTESGDADQANRDRLAFLRTARVGECDFWIWVYTEQDGEDVFVTYQLNSDGSSVLGLASPNGLSPEQFMLAEYYDEVYWS